MKNKIILASILYFAFLRTGMAQTDMDSSFKDLSFDTISQTEFEAVQKQRVASMKPDINFHQLGIEEETNCDQICETYLRDTLIPNMKQTA